MMSICQNILKCAPKHFQFKQTQGKNYKDRRSVFYFLFRMEVVSATAIQMLIRIFQHHMVRHHGLCLPGRQETSLALHLGGPSSHSVSSFEKLPVNDYLHKFMLYMGLRHTTATPLIATVLNQVNIFSSRQGEPCQQVGRTMPEHKTKEMATQQET